MQTLLISTYILVRHLLPVYSLLFLCCRLINTSTSNTQLSGDCDPGLAATPGHLLHLHVHQQLEQELQRHLPANFHLLHTGGDGGGQSGGDTFCNK